MIVSAVMTAMHDVVGIAGYWFLRQSGLTDEEARKFQHGKKKYQKTTCGRKRGPPTEEEEDPDDKEHREKSWRNIPVAGRRPPALRPIQ